MTEAGAPMVGGFNFYAEDLTRQVMGKTRHGSHSVVYVSGGDVNSEIVHYHEEAHRSLNSATTVGKYLSALAIVAARLPKARSGLQDAARNVSTLCVYTHEGYATAMQELLAQYLLSDESSARLRDRMPKLYQIARDQYRTILDRIVPWAAELPADARHECEEIICRVLSIAAMSVPLAGVIAREATLPSYRVLKQIERNAPDTRLQRLSGVWTSEFLGWCMFAFKEAHNDVRATGTSRPRDDCLNQLAGTLCQFGDLAFESPEAINVGAMCEKMSLRGIREYDGRDTPLRNRAILDSVSRAINRSTHRVRGMTWRSACQFIRHTVDNIGVTPDVVCEVILPLGPAELLQTPAADAAILGLHLYCDKQAQRDFLNRADATGDNERRLIADVLSRTQDNAAFLMIYLETKLPDEILRNQPKTIPDNVPHRAYVWVATDMLFQGSAVGEGKCDRSKFESCGRLVFPYIRELNGTETYTALYQVPPKVALPGGPRPGDKVGVITVEGGFNATDLGLLFLKLESPGNEYALPVVFPHRWSAEIAEVGGTPVMASSYLDTCVCYTLVTGVYAWYLTHRSEGEFDE